MDYLSSWFGALAAVLMPMYCERVAIFLQRLILCVDYTIRLGRVGLGVAPYLHKI